MVMKIGLLISPVQKWKKNVISLIENIALFLTIILPSENEQLEFPVYRLSTDFVPPPAGC